MSCPYNIINPVGNLGEFYQINSAYGWRKHPVTGELSFHRGIDIAAPKGTIIRASTSGVVKLSRYSDTAGNYIVIDNQNGIVTKYMHLSSRLVEKGQTVKAGDPIGLIGSTGRVTGTHLHFEMYINGESIDPKECYEKSTRNNPYQPDKFNFTPYLIGGSILLVSIFGIVYYKRRN